MNFKFDADGRLWIEAENHTEGSALNRLTENNVRIWLKSTGGMNYMENKLGEPTFPYIVLTCDKSEKSYEPKM